MSQTHIPCPDRRRVLAGLLGTASAAGLGFVPATARAEAALVDLPPPGPRDACPVCGMIVAKYPEWTAAVLFDDGAAVYFDGAKDFFKYLNDMERYAQGRTVSRIAAMGVTEYYGLKMVDARAAFFVIGSDVYGPMGHELIPLQTQLDADDYFRDHAGVRQVGFDEVTKDMLIGLDESRFE